VKAETEAADALWAGTPEFGVRPSGWTDSGAGFDRLLGVLLLKLRWAEVAER
jgi:hypothetical protein